MTLELVDAVARIARHFWTGEGSIHWQRGPRGPRPVRAPLRFEHLEHHVGMRSPCRPVGLAPIKPGTSETRVAVLDLDSHKGDVSWEKMIEVARRIVGELQSRGMSPIAFRSSGGKGVHIYLLWAENEPQDAFSVRQFLVAVLESCGLKSGTKGVKHGEVEVFPRQDAVVPGGLANMVILPFTRESVLVNATTFALETYETAEVTEWPHSAPIPVLERPKPEPRAPSAPGPSTTELRARLAAIPNQGEHSLGYDEYFKIIAGIHFETGGSDEGLAIANEWSSQSEKHVDGFIEEKIWPYLKTERGGGVITGGTISKKAFEHGYVEDITGEFDVLPPEGPKPKQLTAAVRTALRTATDIDQAELLRPDYLVKGWIDRGSNAVMFGDWNAGKTFVALNLGIHIAAGMPWFGRRVKQAGVTYLPFEGARGIDKRVAALRQQFPGLDWAELPFAWQVLRYPLTTKEGREELQAAIKAFHARFGIAPGLVIIDPLKDALGGDDSDAELMGKLNMVVLDLIGSYGCAVLRLHHSGHQDKTRSRGHSSLPAAADTEIKVGDGTISATKQRDDEKSELGFKLIVVELGVDEDGDAVTTCIVEPDKAPRRLRKPKGKVEQQVLQAAHDLADLGDALVPVEALLEAVKAKRTPPEPGKKDQRRGTARRALDALIAEGFVALEGDKVRLPNAR